MKHSRVTGKAAEERPWLNEMAPNPVHIPYDQQVHDHSGVRRRSRRRMDWLAARVTRKPEYAAAVAALKARFSA